MLKWKEKYRCVAPYDLDTGQFLRDNDGSLSDEDIHIECFDRDMIYDYDSGKSILEAYFSNRQRGRRIVKELIGEEDSKLITTYSDCGYNYFEYDKVNSKNLFIFKIQENDEELWFHFNGNKDLDKIAKIMKAKKPKANTSPYNVQYLPSHKEKAAQKKLEEARFIKYEPPKGYYTEMDVLIKTLMKEKGKMLDKILGECYKKFGKQIKVNLIEDADKNNYKINHYIHYIGQWDNFVSFIRGMINT